GGTDFERKLLRYITETTEKELNTACESPARYRELVGGALEVMIGRNLAEVGKVEFQETQTKDAGSCREKLGLLRNLTHGEELPVVLLQPKNKQNRIVIWVDEMGKAGLFDGDKPSPGVQKLVDAGISILGADLLFQGESLPEHKPLAKTR